MSFNKIKMAAQNTALIARIKELRVNCDELIQNAAVIKTSAETTLAWRSLQMAKCWMGKLLGELGDESPYHEAESTLHITSPADVFEGELVISKFADSPLAMANRMRQEIQNLMRALNTYDLGMQELSYDLLVDLFAIINKTNEHLTEARFWYGFEIQNIRAKNQ